MLHAALAPLGHRTTPPAALQPEALHSAAVGSSAGPSVAARTERQVDAGVSIAYFALLHDSPSSNMAAATGTSWRRKVNDDEWEFVEELAADKRLADTGAIWCNPCSSSPYVIYTRCGFSWDDAAAKMGAECTMDSECRRPAAAAWPFNATYTCYSNLPNYGRGAQGECVSLQPSRVNDAFCQQTCAKPGPHCNGALCRCSDESGAWNVSAPIQAFDDTLDPKNMTDKNGEKVRKVLDDWEAMPSGLPACRWRPKPGTSCIGAEGTAQYECVKGSKEGQCSSTNWFGSAECRVSCVHVSRLHPAPYAALWIPGSEAIPNEPHGRHPRYEHKTALMTPEDRGIHFEKSNVLMSRFCHSEHNKFVGISLYSPTFKDKASRLVRSCERVGVCCKATELPPTAFGPQAPEGSEAFRFQVIAMKPSFILSQLKATELPVVFLDTDLEFQRFPELFLPSSWPGYGRDMAFFNFWANETNVTTKNTPQIGSAIAFFNTTVRAKAVLTAWAEAMAWEPNARAPDDQVLDLLLKEEGWLRRASFGWLPSSYLRLMPSFYRGVVPVVEHDHGSTPGLLNHSEAQPQVPPVLHMELSDLADPGNEGWPRFVTPEEARQEQAAHKQENFNCWRYSKCPPSVSPPSGSIKAQDPSTCIALDPVVFPQSMCVSTCDLGCGAENCRCDPEYFNVPW